MFKNLAGSIFFFLCDFFLRKNNSNNFWIKNPVSYPEGGFQNIDSSLNFLYERNKKYNFIKKYFKLNSFTGKIILDYGCGPGHDILNIALNSKFKKIYACDISHKIIKIAQSRCRLHKIKTSFHLLEKDKNIPFNNNYFDIINCNGVLQHIENDEKTLTQFKKILKKNGAIQIMIYNKNSIWFHLHAGFELPNKFLYFKYKEQKDIFRMSTDGFSCPISRCYTFDNFTKILDKCGLYVERYLCDITQFEIQRLPLIKKAVESNLISEESRIFLKNLKFNKSGIPFFEDKIAGLNSFYNIRIKK